MNAVETMLSILAEKSRNYEATLAARRERRRADTAGRRHTASKRRHIGKRQTMERPERVRMTKRERAKVLAASWLRQYREQINEQPDIHSRFYAFSRDALGEHTLSTKPHTLYYWAQLRVRGECPRIRLFNWAEGYETRYTQERKAIRRTYTPEQRAAIARARDDYRNATHTPTYVNPPQSIKRNVKRNAQTNREALTAYETQVLESKGMGSITRQSSGSLCREVSPVVGKRQAVTVDEFGRRSVMLPVYAPAPADATSADYERMNVRQLVRCADGVVREFGENTAVWRAYVDMLNVAVD